MAKIGSAFLIAFIMSAAFAREVKAEEAFYQGGEFTPLAEVQFTNRTTAVRESAYVSASAPLEYDDMTVTLSRCWRSSPPDEPRSAAWIEVVRHAPADEGEYLDPETASKKAEENTSEVKEEPLFSGWIYAESPALAMPEHPIFTVRLLRCATESEKEAENNVPAAPTSSQEQTPLPPPAPPSVSGATPED
ncbi:MAG: DUF2155 domain-containing protein [Rickettsiales bacterium]